MIESLTILIKRFFLIPNVYIKAAIIVFIIAVLINSGLLLFIPTMHILQYPTIALLFTMLAYFIAFGMGFASVRFKNGKIINYDETNVFIIVTGFVISIVFTCLAVNGYIKNNTVSVAKYILTYLLALTIANALMFMLGIIRYGIKSKNAKNH